MTQDLCPKGHPRTPENTRVVTKNAARKARQCIPCYDERRRVHRLAKRAERAAKKQRAVDEPVQRTPDLHPNHNLNRVHWKPTGWFGEDGRAYLTIEAVEYERATDESFRLAARRGLVSYLKKHGVEMGGSGWWEPWGSRSHDWATWLPTTYTVRTIAPVIEVQIAA